MSLPERGSLTNLDSMVNYQANSGGGSGSDALKDLEQSLNEGYARINEALEQTGQAIQDLHNDIAAGSENLPRIEQLTDELNNLNEQHKP